MARKNLKDETLDKIAQINKTPEDVDFVCDNKNYCTWDQFAWLAAPYFYNNGYGGTEVNTALKVVFKDGTWLERAEYDGSEWWVYKVMPSRIGKGTNALKLNDDWQFE